MLKLEPSAREPSGAEQDPLAVIQSRLIAYPQARYDASPSQTIVHPLDASGFTVALIRHRSQYLVECDGWHEHYELAEDALKIFFLALSPATRLMVWQRGSFRYRWRLELSHGSSNWARISEVGLLVFPFWRRLQIFTLQNRLLQAA